MSCLKLAIGACDVKQEESFAIWRELRIQNPMVDGGRWTTMAASRDDVPIIISLIFASNNNLPSFCRRTPSVVIFNHSIRSNASRAGTRPLCHRRCLRRERIRHTFPSRAYLPPYTEGWHRIPLPPREESLIAYP